MVKKIAVGSVFIIIVGIFTLVMYSEVQKMRQSVQASNPQVPYIEDTPQYTQQYTFTNKDRDTLYKLVNEYRVEKGLKPFTVSSKLVKSAQMKADDMVENNYWSHNTPEGKEPWIFIEKAGYNYAYAGENLARDFRDPESLLNSWINSYAHNKNLINSKYTETGIGYSTKYSTGLVLVMHYASPQ